MNSTGSAKYGISTYGKTYLIEEGFTETPPIRYVLIAINALLLLYMTYKLTGRYLSERASLYRHFPQNQSTPVDKNPLGSLTPFFVFFTINNLIRGAHMIDHTYRPLYYHEPKWAYAKILIAEMEVPTYANFFISGLGFMALDKVLRALGSGSRSAVLSSLIYMLIFVPVSAFNLIHYTIEPPSNYGPFPNFNIAGSGITTLPLIILIIHTYITFPKSNNISKSKDRLLTDENSEEETDLTTPRRSKRLRRRSKTPVRK